LDIFRIEEGDIGKRLDIYAQAKSGQTRNSVQKLIDSGSILVNEAFS